MPAQLSELNEEAMELAWTANAYLDCATRLCSFLIEDDYERDIHRNRVPLHLGFLALELFYKAGLAATGNTYPTHHDLGKLRLLYNSALPDMPLPIPEFIEALIPMSADLFSEHPAPTAQWHFSRFRYYKDKNGQPFPELSMADIKQLNLELERLHHVAMFFMLWIRGLPI